MKMDNQKTQIEPVLTEAVNYFAEDGPEMPTESGLGQIYPNPFNQTTTINYAIYAENNMPVQVKMNVYSVTGQLVANLVNQKMSPGNYTIEWHGTTEDGWRVPKGTYIIRFVTDIVHNVKILVKLDQQTIEMDNERKD